LSFTKIPIEEYHRLQGILEEYKTRLYEYNKLVSTYGYYLKPLHIVYKKTSNGTVKYVYYGRYWYKIVYAGKRNKTSIVKWIYIGREKPLPKLPDPPHHPLEGIVLRIDSTGVYMKKS